MTNLLNPAFAWVCRFMGHKWRRLHKSEPYDGELGDESQHRICKRCAATRLAKKRNRIPKEQAT